MCDLKKTVRRDLVENCLAVVGRSVCVCVRKRDGEPGTSGWECSGK
jgi:hypothetical protein